MRHLIALALIALPAASGAHIVFAEPQAVAGGYYAGFLRVSHGCGASPTRVLRVELPAGVISARPQPKAGWRLDVERAPLPMPLAGEGGQRITERMVAITWTGELPADEFDQFGMMLKLPATPGALYFPTRQTCASGATAWVNVPTSPAAWHDTPNPAPQLILTAGAAPADVPAHHGH